MESTCTTSKRVQVMAMTPRRLLMLAAVAAVLATVAANDDDTAEIGGSRNVLQSAESGGGKSSTSDDSDERKTLSQQVADGKYGLIQRELFADGGPSSAPGVLSYDANPEVPRDTSDNLGGLAPEEIWLAEDHLLVLRGGRFEPDDGSAPHSAPVSPIDDYRAPARQVKIPSKPRVPPPFPVQLQDDGPIQILEAAPPEDDTKTGSPQASTDRTDKANVATGRATKPHVAKPAATPATPPENYRGGAGEGAGLRRPQYPPGPAPPPLDEDDPSIYYPPPYSFYYPKDNSSAVPPGPLVPGIVLPPPPNFFGRLAPSSTTTAPLPMTTTRPTTSTPPSTTTKLYLPPSTSTPAPHVVAQTPHIVTQVPQIVTQAPRPVYFEYFERNKPVPVPPPRPPPPPPPPPPIRTYVSSTAVPLRAFFRTPIRPAQFYFYEEDPSINEVNTPRPPPRYYIATVARPQPQQSLHVNNFDRHIQQLSQEIQLRQRQQRYQQRTRYRQPRPVYQYSFGYEDRLAPTPQPPPHYNVQIQPSVDYRNRPLTVQDKPQSVTPNPAIDHAYFTKQDEGLFDDITKKYFTVFGQKLTSPLPPLLRDDINVNYRRPLPPTNPHSEYVSGGGSGATAPSGTSGDGGPGTFISYRLPGDGAHFYFLTPQLAAAQQQQRQRSDSTADTGYYYPAPPRL